MIGLKPKKGKLLIAEPSLTGDVSFNRSVVLLAEHNDEGSVGFILNKPLNYSMNDLVEEIEMPFPVFNGGPVEQDNLYFIHKVPELIPNSVEISDGIYWGGDFEITVTLVRCVFFSVTQAGLPSNSIRSWIPSPGSWSPTNTKATSYSSPPIPFGGIK